MKRPGHQLGHSKRIVICLQPHSSPCRDAQHQESLASPAALATSSGSDPELDVPLVLRRKSAGPFRKLSSSKGTPARNSRAQESLLVPIPAASSGSASGEEAAADHSFFESRNHPSATPSEIGSEQSHAQGSPPRLHPHSAAAAADEEAAGALLVPKQDLMPEGVVLQDYDPFAAEDIVVPISERVKRAKRKPPAPAYASLMDEPAPIKKKKKKLRLQPHQKQMDVAGNRNGMYFPTAMAAAAEAMKGGMVGQEGQYWLGPVPAQATTNAGVGAAAVPHAAHNAQPSGMHNHRQLCEDLGQQ